MGYIYLGLTILTAVLSQLTIKWRISSVFSGMVFPSGWINRIYFLFNVIFDPFIFIALCLTFISGLCWIATMTKLDISYAYPLTMIGFVSVVFLSAFLFGEALNVYRIVGCVIIVVGVIVASLGL